MPGAKLYDRFDRSPAATVPLLGSAESGQPWVNWSGAWSTSSNKAFASTLTGAAHGHTIAAVETGEADGTIDVYLDAAIANGTGIGLCYRVQDASNFRYAFIYKLSNGSDHYIYSGHTVAGTSAYDHIGGVTTGNSAPTGGKLLRVTFTGTTVEVFYNGTKYGSTFGSATFTTATKHGVESLASGVSGIDKVIFSSALGQYGVILG